MQRENTAKRLNYLIETRNLRQVDILNLTRPFCDKYQIKMNKSDISQYVSGKVEPNQKKLTILAMALDVSESWLAGYDVPMERLDESLLKDTVSYNKNKQSQRDLAYKERWDDTKLLKSFHNLSSGNKQKVIDYSDKLWSLQQMEEEATMPITVYGNRNIPHPTASQNTTIPIAAHANENATPEDIAYDNEIMDSEDF